MSTKIKAIGPNDVVLVHIDNKPGFFARVEDINPDIKRGWWQVKLLILAVPLQTVTWIIDNDQVRGADFTMQGRPIRIERIEPVQESSAIEEAPPAAESQEQKETRPKQARILSFVREAKRED